MLDRVADVITLPSYFASPNTISYTKTLIALTVAHYSVFVNRRVI